MKPFLLPCILSLLYYVCRSQQTLPRLPEIPDGVWVCDQDTLGTLVFKGRRIFDHYDSSRIELKSFRISFFFAHNYCDVVNLNNAVTAHSPHKVVHPKQIL